MNHLYANDVKKQFHWIKTFLWRFQCHFVLKIVDKFIYTLEKGFHIFTKSGIHEIKCFLILLHFQIHSWVYLK